jgi:DNA gyrase subunit A
MSEVLEFEDVIKESFTQYAGAVIQSRALVDVRDCIKPSARQVYYSLFTDKFTADKPFKKTLKAIGSAMRFYIHGDASCEGIIMRSGQPFAMRYPLIEIEGSYGTLTETGNWAASRYTSSRLSQISNYLLQDTNKNTIDEWIDNYDDTEQYPQVLSSLGFYNIVNGSTGIAVGLASSIPQSNLKEVNNALIKLLQDEDISDEEILCYPDFATGATLINKAEVAASLKAGKGKACILQATIDYDDKEKTLIVTDLPYGVYTNTICGEVAKLVSENPEIGITDINDLTGEDVCIKIYLDKAVDPEKIKQILYANTSLQKSYSINMTMLENGRFPKIYGWRQALQAHLDHEKIVYINLYQQELRKLEYRLKIVEGIIKAINNINEVINIIKQSSNTKEASVNLQSFLDIDEEQAKAILDMKLSRLAKLEIDKFTREQSELIIRIANIKAILESEELLKQEMIKRFQEVSNKFSDARRTIITERSAAKATKTTKEKIAAIPEDVIVYMNKDKYIKSIPVKSYRRNKEQVINLFKTTTADMIMLFTNQGRMFRIKLNTIKTCEMNDKGTAVGSIIQLEPDERILNIVPNTAQQDFILFTTEKGIVKKTKLKDYISNTQNLRGIKAVSIKDDDELLSVSLGYDTDSIILVTRHGYSIRFAADDINAQGKTAGGVKGITLNDSDYVASTILCNEEDPIFIFEDGGYGKIIANKAFQSQGRGGKGQKIRINSIVLHAMSVKTTDELYLVHSSNNVSPIKMSTIPFSTKNDISKSLSSKIVLDVYAL